jgi:cytochrome P450
MTTRVLAGLAKLTGLTPLADTVQPADPQAVYRQLRSEWGEVAPIELEPGINAWLVMGYKELCQVLRQERLFPRNPVHWADYTGGRVEPDSPLGPLMFPRPNAFYTDGDEHRRLRAPLDDAIQALRPRQVAHLTSGVCASLIAGFASRGQADLFGEYAMMIPTTVIGRLLGLEPETARDLFMAEIEMLTSGQNNVAGNDRFTQILTDLVKARKEDPANDLTTQLIKHPNFNDDSERVQSMTLTIAAAGGCSMAWMTGTLLLMLTDERFLGRLRGGRLEVDDALDEVLWRNPPMANFPARYAARDTELGGQPIAKGDALILGFAPANADLRTQGNDPWSEIGNRSHLAFGAGPHMCPAEVPARVMVRTAVETALHQLSDLRLAADPDELGRIGAPWTRCPATVPVTFKAFEPK